MNSNINLMAQIPATFGVPACGHAMTTTPRIAEIEGTTASIAWSVVRDRRAVVTGDMGLAQGYFPGTSAWRPPNC